VLYQAALAAEFPGGPALNPIAARKKEVDFDDTAGASP